MNEIQFSFLRRTSFFLHPEQSDNGRCYFLIEEGKVNSSGQIPTPTPTTQALVSVVSKGSSPEPSINSDEGPQGNG